MPRRDQPRKPWLNDPCPHTHTGTIQDFILRQIDAGSDVFSAAGACGVDSQLLQTWLTEAQVQWHRAVASTADWARDFTPEQQDLALFHPLVTTAIHQNRSRGAILLEQHVRGGQQKQTTRTRSLHGQVIEETQITETTLPSLEALKFKLERLHRDVFGAEATLRISTADVSDTPAMGRALTEAMMLVARRMTAIEVGESVNGDGDESEVTE
jgi:hypothetical protein